MTARCQFPLNPFFQPDFDPTDFFQLTLPWGVPDDPRGLQQMEDIEEIEILIVADFLGCFYLSQVASFLLWLAFDAAQVIHSCHDWR